VCLGCLRVRRVSRRESEGVDHEGDGLGEGGELDELRGRVRERILEERKKCAVEGAKSLVERYRAELEAAGKAESRDTSRETVRSGKPSNSDGRVPSEGSAKPEKPHADKRRGLKREHRGEHAVEEKETTKQEEKRDGKEKTEPGGERDADWENRLVSVAGKREATGKFGALSGEVATELPEEWERRLESVWYEKPTVLVQGTFFSLTLSSRDVLGGVAEALGRSRAEGDDHVQRACGEALEQFRENGSVDASLLDYVTRYLDAGDLSASLRAEWNDPTMEWAAIEDLLRRLGADYRRTPTGGLYVLEALEPYEGVSVPRKQLVEMREKTRSLGGAEELHGMVNGLGLPPTVECETLRRYLKTGRMSVDAYLKICRVLEIEPDRSVVSGWGSPVRELVTGEWYNRPDVSIRVHPEDLEKLYQELRSRLRSEGIGLNGFTTALAEAGASISKGRDLENILNKKHVNTVTLREICTFVGWNPSTVRELDRNTIPKEEKVRLSRNAVRRIRQEAWRKYGYHYVSKLAGDVELDSGTLSNYLSGGSKIPLKTLERIEEALGITIREPLRDRIKAPYKDYARETVRGEGVETVVERIEVNEPDGGKKTLLTFIHEKDREGRITRRVKETGETFTPTTVPWFFSSPNTSVTVDRAREFRDGKDLLTYVVEESVRKAGSLAEAERTLDIDDSTLRRWLSGKENNTLLLVNLLTLAAYTGAVKKLSELTPYVERVGAMEKVNKPDLTINLDDPDATHVILSVAFGDGVFRKRGRSYEIGYSNEQEEFVEKMREKMRRVFGVNPSKGEKKDGYHHTYVYGSLAGVSFLGAGVTPGEKGQVNQGIPRHIVKGSAEHHKAATEAMTRDEGSIEQYAQLKISLSVKAPELEEHRDTLNKIEGAPLKGVKGETRGKFIAIGKLEKHKEIQTIAKRKEIHALTDMKEIISKLFEENQVELKKGAIKITTRGLHIYPSHISVSKELFLTKEATEKLHGILGGFPGFKELMYANRTTVWNSNESPINLNEEEIKTLKKLGTQRTIHHKKCCIIPINKLPKELKKRITPPPEIFKLQKQYAEEEIEILVEGIPIKVRGMPSRIKGEVRLYPQRSTVYWTLHPATQKTIKEKWRSLKPHIQKELNERKRKEKERREGDHPE